MGARDLHSPLGKGWKRVGKRMEGDLGEVPCG